MTKLKQGTDKEIIKELKKTAKRLCSIISDHEETISELEGEIIRLKNMRQSDIDDARDLELIRRILRQETEY